MKKITTLLMAFMFSLSANATLITTELNNTNFNVGDVITADIIISDIELDDTFQKLVSSFELALSFNDAIVEFVSASFGDKIDVDPDPFYASEQYVTPTFRSVLLEEIGYALENDLFFAQDGLSSFVLASVHFNVIGTGTGSLGFLDTIIGDSFGNEFLDVSTTGQEYTVSNGTPVGVPEPSSIFLMILGMVFTLRLTKAH